MFAYYGIVPNNRIFYYCIILNFNIIPYNRTTINNHIFSYPAILTYNSFTYKLNGSIYFTISINKKFRLI